MHRGRTYPYHPTYWATEAWFWPGYLPWKMHFKMGTGAESPWDQIDEGYEAVSGIGQHNPRPNELFYSIPLSLSLFPNLLLVVDKWIFAGVPYARWRCGLIEYGPVEVSSALALQTFPQRIVAINKFDSCLSVQPYTSTAGPPLIFRPASYAQGNSPWN
jgi:hypothetical protein